MKFSTSVLFSLFLMSTPLGAKDLWTNLFEENLAKAQTGDQEAAYEVGIMYLKGQGVGADRGQAAEWLKKAADAGSDAAAAKLSRMQANEQEFNRFMKRAEAGDATAQYETGMMYLAGKGIAPDTDLAVSWLGKAAGQGNLKAATRLGMLYLKGDGVDAAPERAVDMLTRASDEEVLAQYYLGEAYAEGLGVKRNYPQAIAWYQKAADNGFARAAGKIINLQEEMRMQQRRKEREERDAAQAAAQAAATMGEKPVVTTKVDPKPAPAAKPKVDPKPRVEARPALFERNIEYLASYNWTTDGKAANFLPSSLNSCEMEKDRLVCYSGDIEEVSVGRKLRYRVKSIITPGAGHETFDVVYRNLVLDVELLDVDSGPAGYGQGEERGFKVKTGWSGQHTAACRYTTDRSVDCLKDGIHDITALLGDARTLSAKR